jgi:hypothetical protein
MYVRTYVRHQRQKQALGIGANAKIVHTTPKNGPPNAKSGPPNAKKGPQRQKQFFALGSRLAHTRSKYAQRPKLTLLFWPTPKQGWTLLKRM